MSAVAIALIVRLWERCLGARSAAGQVRLHGRGTQPQAQIAFVRHNRGMRRSLRSFVAPVSLALVLALPAFGVGVRAGADPVTGPIAGGAPGALSGNWRAATGSYTGYRVVTRLAFMGPQTIAGRTTAVTGSAQVRLISGRERLTAARFTADLRKATTGNAIYDRQAASLLEISRYPTGTFVLATPLVLPSASALAAGSAVSLVGNLTLHGVTRRVTVPARVIGTSSRFTVTGAISVRLTDYRIPLVVAGGLARADDRATVDFRVVFVR